MIKSLIFVIIGANIFYSQTVFGADLTICVRYDPAYQDQFDSDFAQGAIHIPAGTVFDYVGHAYGLADDPRDEKHFKDSKWTNISEGQNAIRGKQTVDDLTSSGRYEHHSGLVTINGIVLTKHKHCGKASVAALISEEWRWNVSPVFGSTDYYFQLYGVITSSGELITNFGDDSKPLDFVGVRGELNAILSGTTSRTIKLD